MPSEAKIPDLSEDAHKHAHMHRRVRERGRNGERDRERERAVNSFLWCVFKPHKMASNHGRDTLRREDVFSVWFTLKPSLIPAWWLPWVFAAPDLTPIALAQSNFWALFGLPRASYLIMKQRERERGRIIYENLAAWNPHTGSIIIIKACPSGLTRDYKKKRIKKKRVDERASEERKQKQKKSDCAFESSKDGYKLLPSKHVLLQFSSRVASKQSDYLVTYTLWQNGNAARGWRSVNRSFWRGKYHIQSGSLSLYPPQRLWYRMTPSFTAEVMSIACSCGRQSASLEIWETYSGE